MFVSKAISIWICNEYVIFVSINMVVKLTVCYNFDLNKKLVKYDHLDLQNIRPYKVIFASNEFELINNKGAVL